jgi:hypothetical protein
MSFFVLGLRMEETYQFFTLIISIIALVISGIALGWNIYRDFIDQASIKIDLSLAKTTKSNLSEKLICLTIVNKGRRSIVLKAQGFLMKDKTQWIMQDLISFCNNKKLEPYESINISIQLPDLLVKSMGSLESFIIVDTIGKKWKVSRKSWEDFLFELRKIKHEQDQKNQGS